MESLGRLQWGQILPPVLVPLTHAWGLVTTPGNYLEGPRKQLSRGQGEFSVFPVGEPKFTVKVIAGGGTLTEHWGSLHCVSCWAFSLMVSLFQIVPTCILTDYQHGIWRLGFLLSLSFTTLSIYDLGLFNLENNLFEDSVSLHTVLRSPSCPHDSISRL